MNREWVREQLEHYRALCEKRDGLSRGSEGIYSIPLRTLDAEIRTHMPKIREILNHLDPALTKEIKDPLSISNSSVVSSVVAAIDQGLGIVRDRDDWIANLTPDSPSLSADEFHPHVWRAASALWHTGRYRVAVEQATVSLSAHIASKAGSHLSDRALVNEVFSPSDPVPGKPDQ